MDSLQSKLKPSVWIVPAIFFMGAIGCWYGFVAIGPHNKDGRFLLFFAILLSLYVAGRLSRFLSKNTGIIISDNAIILTYAVKPNKAIQRSDIKAIRFVSQQPLAGNEGSVIELKDGATILIRRDEYSNAGEIRTLLHRYYSGEETIAARERSIVAGIAQAKTYTGNPWSSYNSVMFYCIIAVSLFVAIRFSQPLQLILIVGFYLFLSSQMYYFKIAGDSLIVRNHYRPWYKKTYKLENIRSLSYLVEGRLSTRLGIVTTDFGSRSFHAGSLRKKDWKELRDDMQSMHIEFVNGNFLA
jgi:hypothetical protein